MGVKRWVTIVTVNSERVKVTRSSLNELFPSSQIHISSVSQLIATDTRPRDPENSSFFLGVKLVTYNFEKIL